VALTIEPRPTDADLARALDLADEIAGLDQDRVVAVIAWALAAHRAQAARVDVDALPPEAKP
jgi:hypothetical protein